MSREMEAVYLCDYALESLGDAYRIVAAMDVPYVEEMLFNAIATIEQVATDVMVKATR